MLQYRLSLIKKTTFMLNIKLALYIILYDQLITSELKL